jgi:hypothetical protein
MLGYLLSNAWSIFVWAADLGSFALLGSRNVE